MNKRFRNSNKIDLPHDIDQESLLSLYDRESRDLELFNSIDAEIIKLSGSKLFYYKVFINENYDRVYLEERNKVVSKDAIVVWASYDPKPIEENVSEFGLELTNDQVFVFNKSYIERAIGRAPQPGDVVESPVQNIKYEIYEVQEDSFEVYGVFHYNCYGRVLRDSSDVVDEPALETFEEVGADLVFTRSDYEDLSVAAMTNADITAPESPPVIVPDPDENILALFANGEVGAWYDPSDLTTVFQDAAGTTPANVGDPVGLILDKSQGLELGSELITNGTFDTATGWTNVATTTDNRWYIENGRLTKGPYSGIAIQIDNPLVAGKTYKIQIDVIDIPLGNVSVSVGNASYLLPLSPGTRVAYLTPTDVSLGIRIGAGGAGGNGVVLDNISVKELPGNHATQTTSAARPVLQQSGDLYYLDFDGVDDSMEVAFSSTQTQPNTIAAAFKQDAAPVVAYVYDSDLSVDRHALLIRNSISTMRPYAGIELVGGPDPGLTDHVSLVHYDGASSSFRFDGALAASGDVGSMGWSGVAIGARHDAANGINGRIYSFVGVNRTLTSEEIDNLETYLAAKSGVTLETAPVGP